MSRLALALSLGVIPLAAATQVSLDVMVASGGWDSEVSWTISCDDGASLNGGAPYTGTLSVTAGSTCTVQSFDSWGDGWNGQLMTIVSVLAPTPALFETYGPPTGNGPLTETFVVVAPGPAAPPLPPSIETRPHGLASVF